MSDFEAWKKYPQEGGEGADSYRLDHPHFQHVQRTTFAKGVITDFKLIAEDPIEVESMVKVEIEGYGESDYIPLFFHPKPQYWDNEETGVQATDFDEEQKCHKQAWMSFRCGDEVVAVMVATHKGSSLEPRYVIGFNDNYPRIGENNFAMFHADGDFWSLMRCSPPEKIYPSDEVGPDGIDLGLHEYFEKVTELEGEWDTGEYPWEYWAGVAWAETYAWGYMSYAEPFSWPTEGNPSHWDVGTHWGLFLDSHWNPPAPVVCDDLIDRTYYLMDIPDKKSVFEFAVIVGPILYLICVLERQTGQRPVYFYQVNGCGFIEYAFYSGAYNAVRWDMDKSFRNADNWWYAYSYGDEYSSSILAIKAGVYTEELLDSIKNGNKMSPDTAYDLWVQGQDWTNQYDGMTRQTEWPSPFNTIIPIPFEPRETIFKRRPHTKEELIEHGFMNADGSLP